jgi:Big-like domain-containing protein
MINLKILKGATFASTALGVGLIVYQPERSALADLPNRIPEAAPYVIAEAAAFPPPYEEHWQTQVNPGQCQNCHPKIFDEWNGSMMANAWRDPVWRAAFLLLARATSANGECDTPEPPDGTPKASHNPFAKHGQCASEFDIGTRKYTVSRPGSLLDAFCSRCHMPTNYLDNIPLRNVKVDPLTHIESARVDPNFNPTADNGTGIAYATLDSQYRNTDSGKAGIFCAICHTMGATRDTPFHNYPRSGNEYHPAVGTAPRSELLAADRLDMFQVADPSARTLGFSIGAGAFRLSPHAIGTAETFGPLAASQPPAPTDVNTSQVFGQDIPYQHMDSAKHKGYHQAMFVRSEMCATCHDVTNALPIKNPLHKWVGGFPIERTYSEWSRSRYADRPGNSNFDPRYKRDCQSCHMQQDYGQPGTAQTLYKDGRPLPAKVDRVATDGGPHPFFTHHFVGGNTLVPRMIGQDVDKSGNVSPYPELSTFSFSSADHNSVYSRGFWTHTERRGAYAQQARLAWDRLRHVLSMNLEAPAQAQAGSSVSLSVTLANTGSGHNFPTGFPEGRNAWLAIHAYDLATGKELPIHDSVWNRTSVGVGNLTTAEMADPNFPGCDWKIPAGSTDPYALQFKAVASLGDGCPTLALPYAAPLNLVTNKDGLPIDKDGRVIDAATNPTGLPQFRDINGNGDPFDDAYLRDTRFKPMPHPAATKKVDRYAVVIPPGTQGPVAVTAAVYYQTLEAMVALKFLGNMADTNGNFVLEPCILGGLCDGRKPSTEPAVVEGAAAVPMVVRSSVIPIAGAPADKMPPRVDVYPTAASANVYHDAVVKAFFSKPVRGVDEKTFTLTDSHGAQVPAGVDQIGDGAWGLFPNAVVLKAGESYTARLKRGICDLAGNCTSKDEVWSFQVSPEAHRASGDTSVPMGFRVESRVRTRVDPPGRRAGPSYAVHERGAE